MPYERHGVRCSSATGFISSSAVGATARARARERALLSPVGVHRVERGYDVMFHALISIAIFQVCHIAFICIDTLLMHCMDGQGDTISDIKSTKLYQFLPLW